MDSSSMEWWHRYRYVTPWISNWKPRSWHSVWWTGVTWRGGRGRGRGGVTCLQEVGHDEFERRDSHRHAFKCNPLLYKIEFGYEDLTTTFAIRRRKFMAMLSHLDNKTVTSLHHYIFIQPGFYFLVLAILYAFCLCATVNWWRIQYHSLEQWGYAYMFVISWHAQQLVNT